MAQKKLTQRLNRTETAIVIILVVLLLWVAYSVNVLESILSGQVFTLRFASRLLGEACKYEANIPSDYKMTPKHSRQRGKNTPSEEDRIRHCLRIATKRKKSGEIKADLLKQIRSTSHEYLNSSSTVIQLGGYHGDDVEQIFSRYRPRKYIVVEPDPVLYEKLVLRFHKEPTILVLNFGIGIVDEAEINLSDYGSPGLKMKYENIISAKHFFVGLGVGILDIDLLTMNCEGCEYAVLDFLISTNIIKHIKIIQFQPFIFKENNNTMYRYCENQEHLKKTHKLMFRDQLLWESWTLKESYVSKRIKDADNNTHEFDDIIYNSTIMDAILD